MYISSHTCICVAGTNEYVFLLVPLDVDTVDTAVLDDVVLPSVLNPGRADRPGSDNPVGSDIADDDGRLLLLVDVSDDGSAIQLPCVMTGAVQLK